MSLDEYADRRFTDPKKAVNGKECINRVLKDEWDDYDSLFYNAWLGVSIEPTRFIDPYILRKLRIETDIRDMITQLELGIMATRAYDLHVDLVRQFMATVELTYSTSKARVAGDGTLTFFAMGIRYRISIPELCRIYGFDEAAAVSKIPPFLGLNGFWEIIGTGAWDSNSATQTDIHHPTLRLRFMPDPQLLRDLPAIPRRPLGVRRARATQGPPEEPLPDFPIIPDIPMRDQGDFQRVVVDALCAIWARVSCTSRRTIRAHSLAAAGPSRQCRDPSSGSNDESSEATD
ncbi:hypothetical protein F2Q70_00012488 [Brassica cretica]|uniref:Arabidopsis retrotransposon Orf1 C-terminal domain-containing protein n=1 Tax=Brassica cretica TaxID=69181 RepID=A0A8S9MBS3_BRACR|nr:hypothetical protein F2Q70_00012488 [Brassica cretica]